ncbi:hypothetical protein AWC38_SpisGene1158 [Stylophora pistillata]|uniref:THD domain-containing protein n=1 Tax=Stylophora pistillata TaxID=50429 RepID=A0A2B4SZN5_STYPI|nr:hypothetical protein AWC38_SpisGene1158 [Stylophora pistillata]
MNTLFYGIVEIIINKLDFNINSLLTGDSNSDFESNLGYGGETNSTVSDVSILSSVCRRLIKNFTQELRRTIQERNNSPLQIITWLMERTPSATTILAIFKVHLVDDFDGSVVILESSYSGTVVAINKADDTVFAKSPHNILLNGNGVTYTLPGLPAQRQSLVPENILLYGDGRRYELKETDAITQWTMGNNNGNNIVYRPSVGRVEVMRDGLYFIYSQMCFSGNRNPGTAGHRNFINQEQKIRSVIGRQDTSIACRYHGGAFYLRAHDTIAVKPTATGQYYMSGTGSFLGVFLI